MRFSARGFSGSGKWEPSNLQVLSVVQRGNWGKKKKKENYFLKRLKNSFLN
jgi:hypothetical protein